MHVQSAMARTALAAPRPPAPEACPRTDGSTPCESTYTYRHGGHHNYQLPLFGLSIMLVGGGAIQHFFSGLQSTT